MDRSSAKPQLKLSSFLLVRIKLTLIHLPLSEIYNMYGAGILEQSVGAWNRLGIGWSYRSARLYRLAESIPWNRFLGSLKV
jgi:hypothetical protein